jgi:DNA-binding LacI/PurR family transcriptional regulator
MRASNIPFVMMGSELSEATSVTFDYWLGMEKAFEELLANGHREITFAGHPDDVPHWDAYRMSCERRNLDAVVRTWFERRAQRC